MISFFLTTDQFLDGSKDVTRRLGWRFLKPGDRLMAVRKAQGLKKGEHPIRLGEIEILSVGSEPLNQINGVECIREGFPNLTPDEFVEMFCAHMGGTKDQYVTRIVFRRVP